jgi:hypothetical protein
MQRTEAAGLRDFVTAAAVAVLMDLLLSTSAVQASCV